MLIASGAVEPSYHKAIISSIEAHGPYIVIAPNFAMPHARPEDGVNHTAFALVTLTTPVYFEGESEPVDVLVTLAGSSSDQHMQGLMEVTQVLDDPTSDTGINLDKLRQCRSKFRRRNSSYSAPRPDFRIRFTVSCSRSLFIYREGSA